MSLSGGNAGYLDIKNAVLRVGTLDVQSIVSGVDTATNIAKTNPVLLWDDQGSDLNTPPLTLSSATRSTSPPYIELDGGYGYAGIKLPNAWMGAFDVYMSDKTDGSVKLHTYTTDTTTYGDTGYELVLNNSGVTLNYDGAQVATAAYTWTNDTWTQVVVGFERGAWTVSVGGAAVLVKDDIERTAVYANVGQYIRFDAATATTTKRVRYINFFANGHWLQSNVGTLSYSQGYVGIGTTNTDNYKLKVDSGSSYDTLMLSSTNATVGPHVVIESGPDSNTLSINYIGYNGDNRQNSLEFRGSTTNPVNFHFTPTDDLYDPEVVIDTSGRLGVGVGVSPLYPLDVGGDANVHSLRAEYVEGSGHVLSKTVSFNPTGSTGKYFLFGTYAGSSLKIKINSLGNNHEDSHEWEIFKRWGLEPEIIYSRRGNSDQYTLYYTNENNTMYFWFNEVTSSEGNTITYQINITNTRPFLNEPASSDTLGVDNAAEYTKPPAIRYWSNNIGINTTTPLQSFHSEGTGLFRTRLGVGNVLTYDQNGGTQDIWDDGSSASLIVRKSGGATPDATYANARAYSFIGLVPSFDAYDTTNIGLWGQGSGENPVFYIQNQINLGQNGASPIALNPVAGSVGIGTSSPGERLQVGSATETSAQYISVQGDKINEVGAFAGLKFKNSTRSGGRGASIQAQRAGDNYGTRLVFYTTADGGSTEDERLTIESSGTATFNSQISMGNRLLGKHNSGDNFWMGLQGSGTELQRLSIGIAGDVTTGLVDHIKFYTNGGPKARLTSAGYFGLGTDSPGELLDVSGGSAWIHTNTHGYLYLGSRETNPTTSYYSAVTTKGSHINLSSPYSGTYYGMSMSITPAAVSGGTMWGNSGLQVHAGTTIISGGHVNASGNNGSGLGNYYGGHLYLDAGISYCGSGGSDSVRTYQGNIYFRTLETYDTTANRSQTKGVKMQLVAQGRLAVGSDFYPDTRLHVYGTNEDGLRLGQDGFVEIYPITTTYGSETLVIQTSIDGRRAISSALPFTREVLCLQAYAGNVGIGCTNPDSQFTIKQLADNTSGSLQLVRAGASNNGWQIFVDGYNDLKFHYNGVSKGYLVDQTDAGQIDFTGQHRSFIDGVPQSEYVNFEGLIVSANKNRYFDINSNVTTGAEAIQISQSLPLVSLSTKAKDKACFGVISGVEDPDVRSYSQGTFASVIDKQKGDTRAFINSLGEGAMWVVNTGSGSFESGDYITTSNVAGYGMLQDDDVLHNYTVAKITMDCDFNPPDVPKQRIVRRYEGVTYWYKLQIVNKEKWEQVAEYRRHTEEGTRYVKITRHPKYGHIDQQSNVFVPPEHDLEVYTKTQENTLSPEVYNALPEDEKTLYKYDSNAFTYTHTQVTEITPEVWTSLDEEEQNTYEHKYFKILKEKVSGPDVEDAVEESFTWYQITTDETTKEPKNPADYLSEVREEWVNVLDEHGQLQWEDVPWGETEPAYKIRYLDADGKITTRHNEVYRAAFVGCTYHCG